ncbi:MAG: hypothetical protein LBG11_09210 [Bifidobacteriaceae bacterium]|jgi:hypothetical protein|nr:hypothetical protein [Bifidobacteriaceae bacterium]
MSILRRARSWSSPNGGPKKQPRRIVSRLVLALWVSGVFALAVPNPAHAYIDPAATSYLIQVVSGLVITLSVAIGVFFRRIVMSFASLRARAAAWRAFQMDDADALAAATGGTLVLDAEGVASAAPSGAVTGAAARRTGRLVRDGIRGDHDGGWRSDLTGSKWRFIWHDRRGFKRRLALALPTGLAGPFLFFGFGYPDLYLQNPNEFRFPFPEVAVLAAVLTVVGGLIVTAVLLALRGRLFTWRCR